MKKSMFFLVLILSVTLWSCWKNPVKPILPKGYVVENVIVDPSYAELDLNINTTQQFTAKVEYTGKGEQKNIDKVTWKVTGTDSGTVTQNGLYTCGSNPNGGIDTVWAVSQFDTTKKGFAVVKVGFYHPTGTQWVRYVAYDIANSATGIITDSDNNVIFGSNVADKNGNLTAIRIASLDKNGKTRWTIDPMPNITVPFVGQMITPDNIRFYFIGGPDDTHGIGIGAFDNNGNLIVDPTNHILYHGTGFSITSSENKIFIGGYDETREAYVYITDLQGNFIRKIRLKPGDNGKPAVTGLFYKNGYLYTAFNFQAPTGSLSLGSMVQKWDLSTDTLIWQVFYDDVIEPRVLVNNNGVVYFLGTLDGGDGNIWFGAGLDENGNELWKRYTQFSTGWNGNEIRYAALDRGNAVAVGHVRNPSDAAVWILNQNGAELRTQRIDLGNREFMQSVAVDNENKIYIVGSVYPPGINIKAAAVAKLDY